MNTFVVRDKFNDTVEAVMSDYFITSTQSQYFMRRDAQYFYNTLDTLSTSSACSPLLLPCSTYFRTTSPSHTFSLQNYHRRPLGAKLSAPNC